MIETLQLGTTMESVEIGAVVIIALYLYHSLSRMNVKQLGLLAKFSLNGLIAGVCVAYTIIHAIIIFEVNMYQVTQINAYGLTVDTSTGLVIAIVLLAAMFGLFWHCVNRMRYLGNALKEGE